MQPGFYRGTLSRRPHVRHSRGGSSQNIPTPPHWLAARDNHHLLQLMTANVRILGCCPPKFHLKRPLTPRLPVDKRNTRAVTFDVTILFCRACIPRGPSSPGPWPNKNDAEA